MGHKLLLDEALADVLGRVIADCDKQWRKELDRIESESRAVIAELRAKVLEYDMLFGDLAKKAEERIAEVLATIKDGEPGQPGRDGIDGKDGTPGIDGKDGEPGERGPEGPQGIPGRDGRDGLPGPVGEKGIDGVNGKDGRDGLDGVNGKDGLGFDDLDVLPDGERGFIFRFARGDQVREFARYVPAMIYRGVHREGMTYEQGDTVTWAGSLWHCDTPTSEKPGEGTKAWTLATKRGRDGKDGKDGKDGMRGPEGPPGRDGRAF